MKNKRLLSFVVLLSIGSALLFLASCKGGYSLSGANVGTAKTVSIDFFQNKASLVSPTLSQTLTEKMKDKFVRESPLKLVPADGDMQISGTIIEYTIAPVALQGTTGTSKNRLTIRSSVKFINKTDPKLNFEEVFSNFADFDATANFTTIERDLNDQISAMMVQDVFNKAVINW